MSVMIYKKNIESESSSTPISATPLNGDEKTTSFLKNDILNGDDTSLGWKVFEAEIQPEYGSSYKTINIATVFTQDDYRTYRSYLEDLNRCSNDGFFSLDSGVNGYCCAVDEYSVFSFLTNGKFMPLKNVPNNTKKELALDLYKAMLTIIKAHKASRMCEHSYVPLNCICEENIYLSQNKNVVTIKILPMVSKSKMNDRDISVDLYDAAYLYFKLRYLEDEAFEDDDFELYIQKCFLPFKQSRPSFEEIIDKFGITDSNDDSVNIDNSGKSIYDRGQTPSGGAENSRVPSGAKKKKTDLTHENNGANEKSESVQEIGDKVKNVFNSAIKSISEAFSKLDTNIEADDSDDTLE